MVVLDEHQVDAAGGKRLGIVGFAKKAAGIAETLRYNLQDTTQA